MPSLVPSVRPLRLCVIGNARSIHVQMRTRSFGPLGHRTAILSQEPADIPGLEVLAPTAGHASALRRARSYSQMIRLLHQWRPDVVVVIFAASPFNWLLPLVCFKPLFVSLAGADILFHQRTKLSPERRAATIRLLELADCVLSRSEYMLSQNPSLRERALVTMWGVDLSVFRAASDSSRRPGFTRASLGIAADGRVVLSPRRLVPICGVASIVEAMPIVLRHLPHTVLLVMDDVPDPEYRQLVIDLIARLGVQEAVRLVPSVRHEDMAALYRVADVAVSVARSDGVSVAVLESMAAGTPVVLGDIPNYAGMFEDGRHCLLADPRDAETIAAAIVRLLTDRPLREHVVAEARAKVERDADVTREAARIDGRISEVLSKKRPRRLGARLAHGLGLLRLTVEPHHNG